MRSPIDEGIPLTLIVQRLMDADLVQPEEGLALLAEIGRSSQPADGDGTQETISNRRPSLVALDTLAQIDWTDAAAVRAALDRARATGQEAC